MQQLRDELQAWEWKFWADYFSVVPTPTERLEYQLAQLTAKLHNVNRGKGPPIKPQDVMPWREPDVWQAMEAKRLMHSSRYSDVDKSFLQALSG